MIYILSGPDDFSKTQFLAELQTSKKLIPISFFDDADEKQILQAANDADLFGDKKLVKVFGFLKKLGDAGGFFDSIANAQNEVVFVEDSLDKRKTETKKILADKRITVKDFAIPQGAEFKQWVMARSQQHGLQFAAKAQDLFMERMGLSFAVADQPLYDLWQVDSELQKLVLYSNGKPVEAADLVALVPENIDDNVFKLTNALGDKNKVLALKHLHDYMNADTASDEKSKLIALTALLADQFRSMLMIRDAEAQGMPDGELAKLTGFTPGRIFVYKKIAKRFAEAKIVEVLKKLEALDEEVKTSDGPARLQLLMIFESLLK